jgi:hypothetical protein
MNVANLQLEGLLMAVTSINHLLVRKGVLTVGEIDGALAKAQSNMTSEERAQELSSANRDATNFPLRLLQITNHCAPEADLPPFSHLARMVGELKPPYNDQM